MKKELKNLNQTIIHGAKPKRKTNHAQTTKRDQKQKRTQNFGF